MSRSNPNEKPNPSKRNFEWNGEKGIFKYYDKIDKEIVEVPLPFRFIILDRLFCIRGFSDTDNSGIWSNDIKDLKSEPLTIRTKKGIEATGLYADVKDTPGAKFATKLYIGYYEGKELEIGTLILVGTSLSAFIDFSKGKDIFDEAVQVKESVEGKKGKVTYQTPVFETLELSEKSKQSAYDLDVIVQEFLETNLEKEESGEPDVENKPDTPPMPEPSDYEAPPPEEYEGDDLPF